MSEPAWDLIVVGAGPAGLMAAAAAAGRGLRTLLAEKNRRGGVKILMSGGNRCNLTHAAGRPGIVEAFGRQGRFLHSALSALGPEELVERINALGVPTKVEPTGKIFPQSDRAADVQAALLAWLAKSGCHLATEEPVAEIRPEPAGFQIVTAQRTLAAAKLILATGGQSYPGCGTRGDGYRLAAALGHTIVPTRPALVPLTTRAAWVPTLKGITVPDVAVEVVPIDRTAAQAIAAGERPAVAGRPLAARRGSLLFTHFGLSGPVVLDVSRAVSAEPAPRRLALRCDFLPDLKTEAAAAWLRDQCATSGARQADKLLAGQLPARLAETLLALSDIPLQKRAAELSKAHQSRLVESLKGLLIPVTGTLGFEKAEVTAGGVSLAEIDSRTMQSKRVPGLYVVGELLDLDGPIGGYNFQAAFSTGWLAGLSV